MLPDSAPHIDFALHAQSLGAQSEHVDSIAELEQAMLRARTASRTYLICINTDDTRTTEEGGCWWEVAVPEVSTQPAVQAARACYELERQGQQQ
ncbi:3D-(3,5/4)-trihydroxycyclohexane-1,2-dione hydrolase [compost metagenome]